MPTEAEIDAAKTPKGGWTKAQLARWGLGWPPPKGWRKILLEQCWRVKDHADGWIVYGTEGAARASQEARDGALVEKCPTAKAHKNKHA